MASSLVLLVTLAAATVSGLHLAPASHTGPTINLAGRAPARGAAGPDAVEAIHPAAASLEGATINPALASATSKVSTSPAAGGTPSGIRFGTLTPVGAAGASERASADFASWAPIHPSYSLAARRLAFDLDIPTNQAISSPASFLADAEGWTSLTPSPLRATAASPAITLGAASWTSLPAASPINPGHLADAASRATVPSPVEADAASPAARVAASGAAPSAPLSAASPNNPGHQAADSPSFLADAAGWALIPSQVGADAASAAARVAAAGAAPWAPLSAAFPINPALHAAAIPSFLADAAGWALIPSPVGADAASAAARVAAPGAAPWAPLSAASPNNPGLQAAATPSFLADAAGWALIPSPVGADAASPAARVAAPGAAPWASPSAVSPNNPGHQAAATPSFLADAAGWVLIPSPVGADAASPAARVAAPGAAPWVFLSAVSPNNPGHQAAATPSFLADAAGWALIPSPVGADGTSPAARVAAPGAAPWAFLSAASPNNPGHQAAATPSFLADAAGWALIPSPVRADAASPAARVAAPGAAPWAFLSAASPNNPGHQAAATPSFLADAAGWAVITSPVKGDAAFPAAPGVAIF